MIRKLLIALALVAALPAFAAAQRQEMISSAAFTASGNSAAFSLSTATTMIVGVDVTAISGTSPFLNLWLQVSDDGGTTWYDAPADVVLVSNSAAGSGALASATRDIVDNITTAGVGQYLGVYKSVASDKVRLKWIISGTTPSFTFSASFVAK